MKKIVYLIAPLMAVPFITGCNKGKAQFNVSIHPDSDSNLIFLTEEGRDLKNVKATEGEDFKFKIETRIAEKYKIIPDQIYVSVAGSRALLEGVTIELSDDKDAADVTISGSKVIGDIVLGGVAGMDNYVSFSLPYILGTTYTVKGESKEFPGFVEYGVNLEVTFGENPPAMKNILINIDGKGYDTVSEYEGYAAYDVSSSKLTITVSGGGTQAKESVSILARSAGYELLESLTWDKIKSYSFSGAAAYLFELGETKTIRVNKINQKVRIIGFNHDDLVGGGKAGITFQFANLFSDENGHALTVTWNDDDVRNKDFTTSTYNEYLTNVVYNALPDPLKEKGMIETVVKKVGVYKSKTGWKPATAYETQLFPLAYEECDETETDYNVDGEGTLYEYFEADVADHRMLKDVSGAKTNQWLRSPCTYTGGMFEDIRGAYLIQDSDGSVTYQDVDNSRATAPCFCI